MELDKIVRIIVGSSFGLILRLFLKHNIKTKKVFYFNNSLLVNVLSSLFLGIFTAISLTYENSLLFFIGFLGCFSTFSSFIYQLFSLIQKRKYLSLILYYIEVLLLSFLFFCLGYLITLILYN